MRKGRKFKVTRVVPAIDFVVGIKQEPALRSSDLSDKKTMENLSLWASVLVEARTWHVACVEYSD